MAKSNLSYIDSTIEHTYDIREITIMKDAKLGQVKSYINAYCGECKELRSQLKEMESRLNERKDDLNTGNYINLKLKLEVNEKLDTLEKGLSKLVNHKDLSVFDSKLAYLNIDYDSWMKNNTKMPEWKQTSSKRLLELNNAFKDIKNNIESTLPEFGNNNYSITATNKLSKYKLSGKPYQKFKSINKRINEIDAIWMVEYNTIPAYNTSPDQLKHKKLYKEWQKLKSQEKQLLDNSLQDVDIFPFSFLVSDMHLGDRKSFGIAKADSLQRDNAPYHYFVTYNIDHQKLSSNMKVSYAISIDEMDFEGQRINERDFIYTWVIRSEEFDNDQNLKFIIEANANFVMDSLNIYGKNSALIFDLNISEITSDIQEKLKRRFENIIVD